MDLNDTITAIATAPGEGGVAIVRLSGPDALDIACRLFVTRSHTGETLPLNKPQPRYLYYGSFIRPDTGVVIDDVIFVYMPAPNSYTGEDVVEIHCHGGKLVTREVLTALLANGARSAEPGEFTRQAYVNSKIDLTQAEAVLDIIRAGTGVALMNARNRMAGRLSKRLSGIREPLLRLLTRLEAELDFSEEEIDKISPQELSAGIESCVVELQKLLSTYDEGSALRDGVKVLILGRPNVGKSSLLNLLLREERAIVTSEPGTTRDIIEEVVCIKGLPVRLMDSAGLREAVSQAEGIGVERAKSRLKEANLVLFVIDSSEGTNFSADKEIIEQINAKFIVVANKSDLIESATRETVQESFAGILGTGSGLVFMSALKQSGLDDLEEAIYEAVTGHSRHKEPSVSALDATITSARHKAALDEALQGLRRVSDSALKDLPNEIISSELRFSLNKIGTITGETTTEDILNRIFSEFCIGK